MLFTKILTILLLAGAPAAAPPAEPPVSSDVAQASVVKIRHSANLLNAEMRADLTEMVDASFGITLSFSTAPGTDVLEVSTDDDRVDLKAVRAFVDDFVWADHCDD